MWGACHSALTYTCFSWYSWDKLVKMEKQLFWTRILYVLFNNGKGDLYWVLLQLVGSGDEVKRLYSLLPRQGDLEATVTRC